MRGTVVNRTWARRASPLVATLASYRREQLVGDLIAGLVVAVMLVPQAMAYAMLAGLPTRSATAIAGPHADASTIDAAQGTQAVFWNAECPPRTQTDSGSA